LKNTYRSSQFISAILEKQIDRAEKYDKNSEEKRWLYLLSSTTGSGKSHSIASVMGKYAENKDKKFIYIVHTIDNLHDIYKKLLEATPSVEDKVLLLQSEADMIVSFFDRLEKHKIAHDKVAFLDEFKAYKPLKELIANMVLNASNHKKAIINHRDTIKEYTNRLKRELRGYFKQLSRSKKETFKKKVSIIFPTAYLKSYHIIFTTTHRFMYSVWQLQSSQKLYDMSIFKNQFLVVDEIDAQKKTMLSILAESASNEVIDKISLFASIHHTLKSSEFLPKYGVTDENTQEIIAFFDEIYENYFEKFSFVYKVQDGENESQYILKSEVASVVENNIKKLIIERDHRRKINYVVSKELSDITNKDSVLFFAEMIRKIDHALNRIINQGSAIVIQAIAEKLEKCKEAGEYCDIDEHERRRLEDFIRDLEYSPEDDEKKYKFLYDSIKHFKRLNKKERKKQLTTDAEDFYLKGFSVVEAVAPEDDGYERMRSGFRFFNLLDTPEYILQAVSSKMFTIGISATATIETVTKNFDLGYLRSSMIPVLSLSHEEIETLNRLYIEDNKQEHRPISVFFTDDAEKSLKQLCQDYFYNNPQALTLLKGFEDKYRKDEYRFKRYKKYLGLYWQFITNTDISSFLVFLNGLPEKEDDTTMRDDLQYLFSVMILSNKNNPSLRDEIKLFIDQESQRIKESKIDKLFFMVSAKTKETYTSEIEKKLLYNGGIAFVFTTYQTMGSGVNIDYAIKTEDGERERDYSAIYCEKPTHIIPRGCDKDIGCSKTMLELLYYLHALYVSNAISFKEFKGSLALALSRNFSKISYNENSNDYINAIMSIIIQAIGRCHRVNDPDDPLFIFADEELINIIGNFNASNITLLPSVKKLLDTARGMVSGSNHGVFNHIVVRKIEKYSNRFNIKVNRLLQYMRHNSEYANEFQAFRDHIIKYPTKGSMEKNQFTALYTPQLDEKRYWYKTENDFSSVNVFMKKCGDSCIEVSEESAGLPLIRNMPQLRSYFEENGYAIAFKHHHLPTPIVFNNFYKGILGEIIGKYVFEKEYGIQIKPLEFDSGYFEFFDFIADNGMLIDFKYYSGHTLLHTKESDVRKKAVEKLQTMGAKYGMIVNIFYHGELSQPSKEITYKDGIFIVPFVIDASRPEQPVIDKSIMKKIVEIFNEYH